jgi:hypothetical protein
VSRTSPASAKWRELDGDHLVASAFGHWTWLAPGEWKNWIEGHVEEESELHERLKRGHLLRSHLTHPDLVDRMSSRRAFLRSGPSHHWIALTRRATTPTPLWTSPDEPGTDMPTETLERVLDTVFMTTSPQVEITLGGGEPFLKPELIRHALAYAQRKNAIARKTLTVVIETSLHRPEDSWANLASDEGLLVRITPASHRAEDADESAQLEWVRRLHGLQADQGADLRDAGVERIWLPDANAAKKPSARITRWLDAGVRAFQIGPLRALDDRIHVAAPTPPSLSAQVAFHGAVIDRLVHGDEGAFERTAATWIARIRHGREPRHPLLRNPSASGTGTLAYGCDGEVYSCRDGFLSALLGEEAFELGSVHQDGYHDLVGHPTVRAMLMATSLEGQPGWSEHPYASLCGTDPVENFWRQGSLHGRMTDSPHAMIQIGVLDHLFRLIRTPDEKRDAALDAWGHRP